LQRIGNFRTADEVHSAWRNLRGLPGVPWCFRRRPYVRGTVLTFRQSKFYTTLHFILKNQVSFPTGHLVSPSKRPFSSCRVYFLIISIRPRHSFSLRTQNTTETCKECEILPHMICQT
jgi:hypothetical protein